MQRFRISDVCDQLHLQGRTFQDEKEGILYFNWSADTVELLFTGTLLCAEFQADCGYEIEGQSDASGITKRATWPWVGVFLDEETVPRRTFEVGRPRQSWLLYQSDQPETHTIRIIKLTENGKSFLGIVSFTAVGSIMPWPSQPETRRLEIVGDSITCGYGNLVKDPARHFFAADEDAWQAYGVLTARNLQYDWSCVSSSGITAVRHAGWQSLYAMEELYAYTDRFCQEKLGLVPTQWDFDQHPNDIVVVNLGTNDNYAIQFSQEPGELEQFPEAYLEFIASIRRLNGPNAHIVCALGPMNHYLYPDIEKAVAKYQTQYHDPRVYLFRFRPIHPQDGLGADGHPSKITHQKMAEELTAFLRTLPQG